MPLTNTHIDLWHLARLHSTWTLHASVAWTTIWALSRRSGLHQALPWDAGSAPYAPCSSWWAGSDSEKPAFLKPMLITYTFNTNELQLMVCNRNHMHSPTRHWKLCNKADEEIDNTGWGRANAQMIHICHNCRTSSQSSSLHNQPSQTFELLHATLQQNDWQILPFL